MTTSALPTEPAPTSSAGTDHASARSSNRTLRRVFAFDRAFAASSALVLTVASPIIANVLDWPTMVVAAIGLALAPYAFLLHHIYRSTRLRSGLAKFTAGGDAAWVVASIVLLLGVARRHLDRRQVAHCRGGGSGRRHRRDQTLRLVTTQRGLAHQPINRAGPADC